jgi:hypothetical protein
MQTWIGSGAMGAYLKLVGRYPNAVSYDIDDGLTRVLDHRWTSQLVLAMRPFADTNIDKSRSCISTQIAYSMMTEPDPLLMDIETLQNVLVAVATSGSSEGGDYKALRQSLLASPLTRGGMPKFVYTCRDLAQFWQFIKHKFPTYQQRGGTTQAESRGCPIRMGASA